MSKDYNYIKDYEVIEMIDKLVESGEICYYTNVHEVGDEYTVGNISAEIISTFLKVNPPSLYIGNKKYYTNNFDNIFSHMGKINKSQGNPEKNRGLY